MKKISANLIYDCTFYYLLQATAVPSPIKLPTANRR